MGKIIELVYQATLNETGADGKNAVPFACDKTGEYELECGKCPFKRSECKSIKYDRAGWEKWKEERERIGTEQENTEEPELVAEISPEEEKKAQIHEFMGVLKTFWSRCCPHRPFSRMLCYADLVTLGGFQKTLQHQSEKLTKEWNKTQIPSLSKDELAQMDHMLEKTERYWVEKALDWNFHDFCTAYTSILSEVGVAYDCRLMNEIIEGDPDAAPFTSLTDKQCEQILDYFFTGENKPYFRISPDHPRKVKERDIAKKIESDKKWATPGYREKIMGIFLIFFGAIFSLLGALGISEGSAVGAVFCLVTGVVAMLFGTFVLVRGRSLMRKIDKGEIDKEKCRCLENMTQWQFFGVMFFVLSFFLLFATVMVIDTNIEKGVSPLKNSVAPIIGACTCLVLGRLFMKD